MSKLREAAGEALVVLELLDDEGSDFPATVRCAVDALRAALAEPEPDPEPEPVAWRRVRHRQSGAAFWSYTEAKIFKDDAPLYASPPSPAVAPLPAHEIVTMYAEAPSSDSEMIEFARAIERAHGIGAKP